MYSYVLMFRYLLFLNVLMIARQLFYNVRVCILIRRIDVIAHTYGTVRYVDITIQLNFMQRHPKITIYYGTVQYGTRTGGIY